MTEPTPDPAALSTGISRRVQLRAVVGDEVMLAAEPLIGSITAAVLRLDDPAGAPHGPQDATTAVGADTETRDGGTAPQTGAGALSLAVIADQLDEFIAQSADGASEDWLRGARCITGRLRLADPAALRDA